MNEPENKPVETVDESKDKENIKPTTPNPESDHPDDDRHATQWMRDAMDCVPYT